MNKKIIIIINFSLLIISLLTINLVIAPPTTVVCCEKTNSSAWCQDTQQENCDENFDITPTSCSGTSFCKPGCCFDSEQGLCMENTPQKVCNDANGSWVDDAQCNVPQCNLGCCSIGDQASFVTLTRCKRLSLLYGLEVSFRTDIPDELSCIATAFAQEKGACVFESEFETTCRFTTREECSNAGTITSESSEGGGFFSRLFGGSDEPVTITSNSVPEFYRDMLCSAPILATNCGKSTKTTCVEGKEEVYFLDSCGNIANIYDWNRRDDDLYWSEFFSRNESCNPNENNADSKECGNCDYFKGSICSEGNAKLGDNICIDLGCEVEINGNIVTKQNGESWCVYDDAHGEGADVVGSRHFRHLCVSGEELEEPCDDYRGRVCIESESKSGDFTEAGCRVNRWKDCVAQKDQEDCENTDKRDCFWLEGATFTHQPITEEQLAGSTQTFSGSDQQPFSGGTGNAVAPITGNALLGGDDEDEDEEDSSGVYLGGSSCVPNTPPGLKFWEAGSASSVCSLGNSVCIVELEEGLVGGEDCVENCECLEPEYAKKMNDVCTSLGDCGSYVNIAGVKTEGGAEWRIDGDKQVITGILGDVKKGAK
jgi:hypothetical protein